jgi:uncharacterized LabA/DUF88 family protein
MTDRALLFVDGNNWYHGLKRAGLNDLGRLDYVRVAKKLAGPRDWIGLRYYVGQVPQTGNSRLHADQQSFVAKLLASDPRMTVHFGRIEPRTATSDAAKELLDFLSGLRIRIDQQVYKDLVAIGARHKRNQVWVEKGVDVMLAVDLVVMAERNEFDSAYILSADGDYTHAVEAVRHRDKRVYAVSAEHGAQLAGVVNSFLHLPVAWFKDCMA